MARWLVKFAPFRYSWADCLRHGRFEIYGVRSPQARNHLAQMQVGEEALFYHSQQEQAVVGHLRITHPAHPDPTTADARWLSVTFAPIAALSRPLPLAELHQHPALASLALLRQPRLAVMPLTETEFQTLLALSEQLVPPTTGRPLHEIGEEPALDESLGVIKTACYLVYI